MALSSPKPLTGAPGEDASSRAKVGPHPIRAPLPPWGLAPRPFCFRSLGLGQKAPDTQYPLVWYTPSLPEIISVLV